MKVCHSDEGRILRGIVLSQESKVVLGDIKAIIYV